MTTSERLFAAGLLAAFDAAILANDVERAIDLLVAVELPRDQAAAIVGSILANPARYGFSGGP